MSDRTFIPHSGRFVALRPAMIAAAMAAWIAGETPPVYADADASFDHDPTILRHRERQAELAADSQAILAKLDAEGREPTADEDRAVRENTAEITRLGGLIDTRAGALQQIQALARPGGRRTTPDAGGGAAATPGVAPALSAARDLGSPARHSGSFGFGYFGEFTQAVLRASLKGNDPNSRDPRLNMAAATTIGSESVGADGGFAVPPEYRDRILAHVFSEETLLGRTDQQFTSKNQISYPKDETTPWGTTGVRVYWENEAAAITQSKPALGTIDLKLSKLSCLVPITEELLDDAPGMGSFVESQAGRGMNWAVANTIVDGTGAGQPLGILRSPALVTVAAEGAQTADTVNIFNVSKMWVRMPAESRQTAVWLVNPDVEQQLIVMTLGGTAAAHPVYLPPNGMSGSPFATLLGRPVIPHMACKAIGDVGDIIFADLKSYLTAVKSGGVKSSVSVHLWFDQDLVAFKFQLRIDGRPWMSSAISPKNGSSTLSPFIALAAR